jgi:hypothetical protein
VATGASPADSIDPFTAIEAAIASGSIGSAKGEQLENRIATIERLAATDPGLDVSLLENRVLAALPATSVWSSSGTSPPIDFGSGLLAVDSSAFVASSGAISGSAVAFAPCAAFGGNPAAVPEPSTLLLAALGALGLAFAGCRRAIRRSRQFRPDPSSRKRSVVCVGPPDRRRFDDSAATSIDPTAVNAGRYNREFLSARQ